MPPSRAVPPKSTLAASRKATVPWGLSPTAGSSGDPARPRGTAAASGTSARSAASAARRGETPLSARAATTRGASEQRLIALLIATMLGVMVALAAIGARASMSLVSSERQIGSTLGRASLQQKEFHTQHARFALWEELARSGASLPANLSVVRSNASPSHWYLSVRDRTTGLTCDRVGQLIDPPTDLANPICTRSP